MDLLQKALEFSLITFGVTMGIALLLAAMVKAASAVIQRGKGEEKKDK